MQRSNVVDSRNGLMEHPPGADRLRYALMMAARITLAHFEVSSAMSLPKSDGVPEIMVKPNSTKRATNLSSASAALISLLRRPVITLGVFCGAPMPYQTLASYPGTKSPIIGISGSACQRPTVVTAKARSLPARMCSIAAWPGKCTCT
jgi:hypothetical protein